MTKSKKSPKVVVNNHKKRNKKKKTSEVVMHKDSFWTDNTEERQKIREFWLQLGEDERRSLVKVEKEAVLRKMKEQQKHSCNCSVCGKKRTAIEDELEVLYDAYYEELEQYANHQQGSSSAINYIRASTIYHNRYSHTLEEEDDDDEEEDDDDYDDEADTIHYSSKSTYPEKSRFEEMRHIRHSSTSSHDHQFGFGNSLTVKDMMERLAERRMRKENFSLDKNSNYYQEDEEEEEEEDDDDEEDTRTEEQRMEEGRRMFQIFAARMFEQRVFAAYREKVAQERQKKLLEELEEEERLREEREAKKHLEREKKKSKKRQLKKQQEEQRLALEAKKKAEEEKLRKQKEKRLEEERQRREKERLKKEEEKKQREEERLKKEEERKRKMKEEKDRERKRKMKEEKDRERKRKEKEEKEENDRKEKERIEKEQKEKEIPRTETPPVNDTVFENRQQALIDALVGSPSHVQSSLPPPPHTSFLSLPHLHPPQSPLPHLHNPHCMPISRHLSPFLDQPTPLPDTNPILGLFNKHPNTSLLSQTPTRRSTAPIAPIGQPIHDARHSIGSPPGLSNGRRAGSEGGATQSFFSSFLFGEPQYYNSMPESGATQDNRISSTNDQTNWKNGWTASSLLSENVHDKLFGDVLVDRTSMILERAKVAYQKLNELTQVKTNEYHTLIQLHCMMNDLYMDFHIDIRELYDILAAPSSNFQCFHHGQGIVICYNPKTISPTPSSLLLCNGFINTN